MTACAFPSVPSFGLVIPTPTLPSIPGLPSLSLSASLGALPGLPSVPSFGLVIPTPTLPSIPGLPDLELPGCPLD